MDPDPGCGQYDYFKKRDTSEENRTYVKIKRKELNSLVMQRHSFIKIIADYLIEPQDRRIEFYRLLILIIIVVRGAKGPSSAQGEGRAS